MEKKHTLETDTPIYYGSRGTDFKTLIQTLLKKGNLKPKYINLLTDDQSMEIYNNAFTSSTANETNNYEIFEQLGDVTANKFIVWYMYRRFPQLNCTEGVKVIARLRINYGAKQSFFTIADNIGFWPFITASEEQRNKKRKSLLEDALESFIGATEFLIDTRIKQGVGYSIVYDILEKLFNDIPISLKYEDLYDAKTRLKELFDFYNKEASTNKIGSLEYENIQAKLDDDKILTTVKVYQVISSGKNKCYGCGAVKDSTKKVLIGIGTAALQPDAQQNAAKNALETLQKYGYNKPIPEIYKTFCV
jgi:dsRNA-specific ribonuclease